MQVTKQTLLDPELWNGLGFIDGWHPLHDVRTVVEPATGATLGRIGMGNAADIARATASARRAQTDWAALRTNDGPR